MLLLWTIIDLCRCGNEVNVISRDKKLRLVYSVYYTYSINIVFTKAQANNCFIVYKQFERPVILVDSISLVWNVQDKCSV